MKKIKIYALAAMLIAGFSFASYRVGQIQATNKGIQLLVQVSLQVAEPSIQILNYAHTQPAAAPKNIQISAESAVLLLARLSPLFERQLDHASKDSKRVLCAVAGYKEFHGKSALLSDLFNDLDIVQLNNLHQQLAANLRGFPENSTGVGCYKPLNPVRY